MLGGRGSHTAIIFEGDRWDPSRHDGRGGPVHEEHISYRRLLRETVLRAQVLKQLGLARGDRIAFNLPNILEQIYYTEAAKRLGIIYTPVFGGFSAKTLSDRIYDAGARVVITADGGYRNAEVVSYKEAFTDQALDNFIPGTAALACFEQVLANYDLGDARERIVAAVHAGVAGEITLERSDLMRELGAALAAEESVPAERSAELRTAVARELAGVSHTVEQVVVVRYTGRTSSYSRGTAGPRTSWPRPAPSSSPPRPRPASAPAASTSSTRWMTATTGAPSPAASRPSRYPQTGPCS